MSQARAVAAAVAAAVAPQPSVTQEGAVLRFRALEVSPILDSRQIEQTKAKAEEGEELTKSQRKTFEPTNPSTLAGSPFL